MKFNPKDFWGISEDKNIRSLPYGYLKFLYLNNVKNGVYQKEYTFINMVNLLQELYDAVSNLMKSVDVKKSKKKIERFGCGLSGFTDFFSPYIRKEYGTCLEVIEKETDLLRKKDNEARTNWLITEGVKAEMIRRGIDLSKVK